MAGRQVVYDGVSFCFFSVFRCDKFVCYPDNALYDKHEQKRVEYETRNNSVTDSWLLVARLVIWVRFIIQRFEKIYKPQA